MLSETGLQYFGHPLTSLLEINVLPHPLLAEIDEELVFLSPYTYISFAYTESQQNSLQPYASLTAHFQLRGGLGEKSKPLCY